mgnify:CR=1 FL=1
MVKRYEIVERLNEDAEEISGWGAGNEAAHVRQAAYIIQSMAEALAFYADERNYRQAVSATTLVEIVDDAGGRARSALALLKETIDG